MIGVALVGVGYWGPKLLRALTHTSSVEPLWVVDANPASQAWVDEEYPTVRFTTTFADALGDERVAGVVIATPAGTHHALVLQALQAGKHVMVEKPLTDDSASAQELVALADSLGLCLMVGHTYLFNSGIVRIKHIMDSGELGKILGLRFSRTNLGIIRPDVNVGWDLAVHDVAISNWLLGKSPETVSATGAAWVNPPAVDSLNALLNYSDGISAEIHVSWLAPEKQRKIWIIGDKKMLVFDDTKQNDSIHILDMGVDGARTEIRGKSLRLNHFERGGYHPDFVWQEPLVDECSAFIRAIEVGAIEKSDGQFGIEVMQTLEAMDASAALGGAPEELTK